MGRDPFYCRNKDSMSKKMLSSSLFGYVLSVCLTPHKCSVEDLGCGFIKSGVTSNMGTLLTPPLGSLLGSGLFLRQCCESGVLV